VVSKQCLNALKAQDPVSKERIFLSVDIIGSTSEKVGDSSGEWAGAFSNFLFNFRVSSVRLFNDFKERKVSPCESQSRACECDSCALDEKKAVPKLWKLIGDEVVLMAELSCVKHHAYLHVKALAEAIKSFHNSHSKLRVKGTAWVAGFPVRNIEIYIPKDEEWYISDFLGPSIDLGFRLSKKATESKLVISPSLAYLIAKEGNDMPLYYDGLEEVSGFKDKQPIFWYAIGEHKGCNRQTPDEIISIIKDQRFGNSSLPFIPPPPDDARYKELFEKTTNMHRHIEGTIQQMISTDTGGVSIQVSHIDSGLDKAKREGRIPTKPAKDFVKPLA